MRKLFVAFILSLLFYTTAFGINAEVLSTHQCETVTIYVATIDSGVPELEVYAFGILNKTEPEQPKVFVFIDTTSGRRWAVEMVGDKKVEYTIETLFQLYPTACAMFEKKKA